MKIRKILVNLFIIGQLLILVSINTTEIGTQIKSMSEDSNPSATTDVNSLEDVYSFNFIPHAPIDINSNDDFEILGFIGIGSKSSPYIISGYNITAASEYSSAICISHTTCYFVIRNCYLTSGANGIWIDHCMQEMVEVVNNTCVDNLYGIHITNTLSTKISNNTCMNNEFGIVVTLSEYTTLYNNDCSNNHNDGIYLFRSSSSSLKNNTLENNSDFGVSLYDSDSCIIYYNTFIDNKYENSQANDNGKKNKWFNPELNHGNFWSDLGDKCTYAIFGSASSKDLYPLNKALTCYNPKIVSAFAILIPVLIVISILIFVTIKYIIPYIKKSDIK